MVKTDYLARKNLRAAVVDYDNENANSVSRVIPKSAKKIKIGNVDIGYYHDPKSHRKRSRNSFDMGIARLREIEAIISHMFQEGRISDPSGTDDYDNCVAFIRQAALAMTPQDMTAWCAKWAPWADADLIAAVEKQAAIRARKTDKATKADACGRDIGLTWAMRCALGIKTIAAADMTAKEAKESAKERKRERDRTYAAQKRKAAGMQDRESYLDANSLSREKPWEALGMKRSTWYAKGKPDAWTSLSRVPYKGNRKSDTLVQKAPQPVPPRPFTDIKSDVAEAARAVGEAQAVRPAVGVASGSTVPPAPRLEIELKKAG